MAARLLTALFTALMIWAGTQGQGQSIIRDAEIERGLRELAAPILAEAGLPRSVRIVVVNDDSLNAFVADRRHIFIYSGLLMRLETPAEVQAVIAHEAAHLANGHLTTRAGAGSRASAGAALGLALALAVASTGNSEAGLGIAAGTQSAALRNFLSHTRAQEASADQSALRYMVSAGIDPQAMRDVLELFRGQEALSAGRQDPYLRTHPLTRDRLRSIEAFIAGRVGTSYASSPEAQYWYDRTLAKLSAFLRDPRWTLSQIGSQTDEISTLRRAIALHRRSAPSDALAAMSRLLGLRPNDAYYQELQGQILFESRQFSAAVAAYGRAVQLAPREALILAGYGRALLALETSGNDRTALDALERSYAQEPANPRMLRDLALAYARTGSPGMASSVTAERFALIGQLDTAAIHAERASGLLPSGSPGWQRAQDVLRAAQSAQN
ncbi:MAG: M48 family metalloprotease [Pseudomonadota bacterium]